MHTPIPETFGRRVADCRERRGWTQKKLADVAGVSVTFISELENDHRSPGAETLLRIADALGASLDYLVKGVVEAPPLPKPVILPPALAEAAEERGWTVGEAMHMLKNRQMVVARRSPGGGVDELPEEMSEAQWCAVYARIFGDQKDDATR
jgi:transcriptional regulator with XRE-family HTH domain